MPDRLPTRPSATPVAARLRSGLTTRAAAASGVVAAVVGGGLGALGGVEAGLLSAAVVGALGWLGGAAASGPGPGAAGRRRNHIDPFALGEPWRHFVRGALQAQARFDRSVAETRPGPLRDRLVDVGRRLDGAVHECWEVAQRGDALKDAIRALDVAGVRSRLEALTAAPLGDDASAAATVEALESRLRTAERLHQVSEEAEARLRLLDARLGEAVARGVELSVRRDEGVQAAGLGADVDDLVLELTALRSALEETSGGDTGAAGR